MLDRAEGLLGELCSASKEIRILALIQGLAVYQSEKEWAKAIQANDELLRICSSRQRPVYQKQAAHFFCEIAQNEIELQHQTSARVALKKAIQMDGNNIRASLLLGKLEIQLENYKEAIKVLSKVKQQDALFFSEAFPLLLRSYQRAGKEKKTQKFIHDSLDSQASSAVLLAITGFIEEQSGKETANEFLLKQLKNRPSLKMLSRALMLAGSDGHDSMNLFHTILSDYIKTRALYKCNNCGFQLKTLHWLCPGCSVWGGVKPDHMMPQD